MSCSRRADRRMARFWVAYAGIPAFIVTLAGLLMFRGLTQVVLGGQSLAPFPAVFQKCLRVIYQT